MSYSIYNRSVCSPMISNLNCYSHCDLLPASYIQGSVSSDHTSKMAPAEKFFQQPNISVVVTVSSDCVAKIWSAGRLQLQNFLLLRSSTEGGNAHVTKAIVLPNTRMLVVGYSDGTL